MVKCWVYLLFGGIKNIKMLKKFPIQDFELGIFFNIFITLMPESDRQLNLRHLLSLHSIVPDHR